jgi:hypothetical protein
MSYEITYPATVDLARRAYRRTLWRDSFGWRLGYLLAALLSCLAVFAKFEPVFAGFGLGASFAFLLTWYVGRANYFTRAHRAAQSAGVIHWRFEEDAFYVRSADREGIFQWRAIEKLRRFPDVWILQFEGGPSPLPADALSGDLREFIERKVHEVGGRVY